MGRHGVNIGLALGGQLVGGLDPRADLIGDVEE